MNDFATALGDQVTKALRLLELARDADHEYEVHLHAARIRDLLDLAARHDIDTGTWVDAAVLDAAIIGP